MIGDAGNLTDGLIFNPNLKPHQTDGFTSGTRDDRWAFTNMSPTSDIASATALASASRALKSYNNELANECLQIALKVWDDNIVNKKEGADNKMICLECLSNSRVPIRVHRKLHLLLSYC